ncbi:hypothetical protein [Planctomycetes bacterium K23_9]|uniref:Competence protein A n=1 Tax=Stieleria marina TaxID=1930275 RepID=A0A517P1S1_9BACT|nr:hypothetical protein K239x_53450 [Planctomycetes bacterium K23_9]
MTTKGDVRSSNDAIGVMFARDYLYGCRASRSVFGIVHYQYAKAACANNNTDAALADLLNQLNASTSRLPIVAAIPTDECYFATRPTASGAANASPRALLRESLRSSNSQLDKMAIDVINWQPDKRTVAGIVAAPNDRIEAIRESVAATGHSLQRLEPAAACLIGAAPESEGRERRSSLTTRVILGQNRLLAATSRGTLPIYWQSLPLPTGDEATGIVSAIRSLDAASQACGIDRTPDHVVLHGRRELHALMDQQWLEENTGADLRWVESPNFAGQDVAKALADKFLSDDDEGFDFVRQHRDPLQLRRVVPYKEIVAYVMAAAVLFGVLWLRSGKLDHQRTAILASAPPMVGDGTDPKPERTQLNARATAVSQFLHDRVRWSDMLTDITHSIPEGMRLTGIRGSATMSSTRKKKAKVVPATLVLQAEAALNENGDMPTSLDSLAESIKQISSVARSFEHVELSNIRQTRSQETGVAGAEFSIVLTNDTKGGR